MNWIRLRYPSSPDDDLRRLRRLRRPCDFERGRRLAGGREFDERPPYHLFWAASEHARQLMAAGADPELLAEYAADAREAGGSIFSAIIHCLLDPSGDDAPDGGMPYELFGYDGEPHRWSVADAAPETVLRGYAWVSRPDGVLLEHGPLHQGPEAAWGFLITKRQTLETPMVAIHLMTVTA
jgi:hypothetical protein